MKKINLKSFESLQLSSSEKKQTLGGFYDSPGKIEVPRCLCIEIEYGKWVPGDPNCTWGCDTPPRPIDW